MSVRIYTTNLNRSGGGLGLLMFLAGIALLGAAFFLGATAVIKFFSPLIYAMSLTALGVFVVIVFPLSLFSRFRLRMAGASLIIGQLISVSVWMYAFLFLAHELQWLAFVLVFFFKAVPAVAIIGLLIKGEASPGLMLASGALAGMGIKTYAAWLASSAGTETPGSSKRYRSSQPPPEVIDIEGDVEG